MAHPDDHSAGHTGPFLTIPHSRQLGTGGPETVPTGTQSTETKGGQSAASRATSEGPDGSGVIAEGRRASAILRQLGEEFVKLREQNRTSAWAAYQQRIARNLHILVPVALSLKDATSLLREIEEFMKNDQGASVSTPSEIVREWLNAPSAETAELVEAN